MKTLKLFLIFVMACSLCQGIGSEEIITFEQPSSLFENFRHGGSPDPQQIRSTRNLEYTTMRLTTETSSQTRPAIATSPDGVCSVVWQDNRDGNHEIYFCRINQNMQVIVPPTNISNTSGSSIIPKIDTDANGNSYIVWTENGQGVGGHVYYTKVGPDGTILVPRFSLSGDSWDPVISTNPDGTSGIAYQGASGPNHRTYFEIRNAQGGVQMARYVLRNDIVTTRRNCSISNDPAGYFWVLRKEYDFYNGGKYWIAKISPGGNVAMNGVLRNTFAEETCIAMANSNGGGWLFYIGRYNDGSTNYYRLRSIFDGQAYHTELDGDSRWPQVAVSPDVNLSIIWEVNRNNSGDYDVYGDIYYQGQLYTGFLAESDTYNSRFPDVAHLPDGMACFVWQDNRHGHDDIFFAKCGPDTQNNFTISGYVRGSNDIGLDGVTVIGAGVGSCITQADGSYQLTVPEGWSGEISASLPGWLFNQPISISNVTEDMPEQNIEAVLAPPVFSHEGGNYSHQIYVSLSTQAEGARIRYAFGDDEPNSNHGPVFYPNMPGIPITQNTKITAVAYMPAQGTVPGVSSDLVAESYIINGGPPLLNIHISDPNNILPSGSKIRLCFSWTRKNVEADIDNSNTAQISKTQIQSRITPLGKTTRLEIRNGDTLLGHIKFSYTYDDLKANKIMDLWIAVAGPPDTNGFPEWKYYEAGENMVYMLIPPNGRLPETVSDRLPVLLVHGLNGYYPYWESKFVNGIESEYDTWQFYYPYDQQVEKNAQLLDAAISQVLSTNYYPSGTKVSLVTHSMGGIIGRYYIQDTAVYNQDVRKFLMIAPPNHGSFGAYKATNETVSGAVYSLFKDSNAPAVRQLAPGSLLMNSLNSSAPHDLYYGAIQNQTYLVIAGTKHRRISATSLIHHELWQMDDEVVAVPSASLLDDGIPLAMIHMHHNQLAGGFSYRIVLSFLNQEYDPSTFTNLHHHTEINDFWIDINSSVNDPNPSAERLGTLLLRVSNQMNLEQLYAILDGQTLHVFKDPSQSELIDNGLDEFRADFYISSLDFVQWDGHKSSYLYTRYFIPPMNMYGLTHPSFSMRDMGFKGITRNYQYMFYNKFLVPVIPSIISAPRIERFRANTIDISFSEDQLGVLNAPNLTPFFNLTRERDDSGRARNTAYYLVDGESETAIFYLLGKDDDPGFATHGLTLSSPDGTIIDSLYASTHPEWTYVSNTEGNYAYYYTQNPPAGTWTMQYSDQMQDPVPYCFVDGSFILALNLSDSVAEVGQTVSADISIPSSVSPSNCVLTAQLSHTSSSGEENDLGPLSLSYDEANLVYNGSFVTQYSGVYKLAVQGQFDEGGVVATRYIEGFVQVDSLGTTTLLQPQQESVVPAGEVTFAWSPVTNATEYTLLVYGMESDDPLQEVTLADTVAVLEIPPDTYCNWYVIAHAADQVTASQPGFFQTNLAQATCVSPPDNSENLAQVVDLTWEPVEGAECYQIQVAFDQLFENAIVDMVNLGQTDVTIEGLSNLITYHWRVRAVRDDLVGLWSTARSFTVRGYTIDFPEEVVIQENESLSLYLPRYMDNYDPEEFQITLQPMTHVSTELGIDYMQLTPDANWYGQENLIIVLDSAMRLFNLKNNQYSQPMGNRYTLTDTIRVVVNQFNEPPVLNFEGPLLFWDNESKVVDLSPYISDPDNTLDEVRLLATGSSHIAVSVDGLVLTLLPDAGWFGEEMIQLSLDNYSRQTLIKGTSLKSKVGGRRNVSTYSILVAIIDPTPTLTDIQVSAAGVSLTWETVRGADAYLVMHSPFPEGPYTDVTATGAITYQGDHVLWQQDGPVEARGFFKVVALKGSRFDINSRRSVINKGLR